jgi:hypothetical protein
LVHGVNLHIQTFDKAIDFYGIQGYIQQQEQGFF